MTEASRFPVFVEVRGAFPLEPETTVSFFALFKASLDPPTVPSDETRLFFFCFSPLSRPILLIAFSSRVTKGSAPYVSLLRLFPAWPFATIFPIASADWLPILFL